MADYTADWHGCYDDGWRGHIVDDAFAHPAKMAYGLLWQILEVGRVQGWFKPGDVIGDPFGGIGSTGILGAYHGYKVVSVELEERFVELAHQNFALHSRKWSQLGEPEPVMIHGDSREFARLIREAVGVWCEAVVCSPPYAESPPEKSSGSIDIEKQYETYRASGGGMSLEGFRAVQEKHSRGYGSTDGNLGNLPSGSVDAVVSSPPYAESVTGKHAETETAADSRDARRTPGGSLGQSQRHGGYGVTNGQIGAMKEGKLAAIVSSPPYGECGERRNDKEPYDQARGFKQGAGSFRGSATYGTDDRNIGNTTADTYWEAVQQVYEQCRLALKPGGVMVLVVKSYVKTGKRVDLPGDTIRLCESLGFTTIERIRAWLVSKTQEASLFGGDIVQTKERKSFFRRVAESKGSPPIDWEEVLVFRTSAS